MNNKRIRDLDQSLFELVMRSNMLDKLEDFVEKYDYCMTVLNNLNPNNLDSIIAVIKECDYIIGNVDNFPIVEDALKSIGRDNSELTKKLYDSLSNNNHNNRKLGDFLISHYLENDIPLSYGLLSYDIKKEYKKRNDNSFPVFKAGIGGTGAYSQSEGVRIDKYAVESEKNDVQNYNLNILSIIRHEFHHYDQYHIIDPKNETEKLEKAWADLSVLFSKNCSKDVLLIEGTREMVGNGTFIESFAQYYGWLNVKSDVLDDYQNKKSSELATLMNGPINYRLKLLQKDIQFNSEKIDRTIGICQEFKKNMITNNADEEILTRFDVLLSKYVDVLKHSNIVIDDSSELEAGLAGNNSMENQEKFKLVTPTMEHKDQAIEYIKEHHKYNAETNGTGGLIDRLDNYEKWLQEIDEDRCMEAYNIYVPTETYFLVRENDNKIIGMTRIRLELNDHLRNSGGNIEYGIRPTERRKGYNKINLYLILLECQRKGLEQVMLECKKTNLGSAKTIQALCGELSKEYIDEKGEIQQHYWIDIQNAIDMKHEEFEAKLADVDSEEKVQKM